MARTAVVTGANSGTGFEACKILACKGYDVVLACRNEERGEKAIRDIKQLFPNSNVAFRMLELDDLDSVQAFAKEFLSERDRLDLLINNAGVMYWGDQERQLTRDGFEMTMGVNYLGHFLLTHLLLEIMKKTAALPDTDVRIVNVTSSLHDIEKVKHSKKGRNPFDIEDLMLEAEGSFTAMQAYRNSKTALIMFTYSLAEALEHSSIKVIAVCPGFIPETNLKQHSPANSGLRKFFMEYILFYLLRPFGLTKTVAEGGQAICQVALDEDLKDQTRLFYHNFRETESSLETYDVTKQKQLWKKSIRLVKL